MNRDITVKDAAGHKTRVVVRELRPDEFPVFTALAEREEALAAYCTGLDAEFVHSLPCGAVLAIAEAARDVNLNLAVRWAKSRCQHLESLLPAITHYERAKPIIAQIQAMLAEVESDHTPKP